jgi:tetratricopeptide (TPR) repeat protein
VDAGLSSPARLVRRSTRNTPYSKNPNQANRVSPASLIIFVSLSLCLFLFAPLALSAQSPKMIATESVRGYVITTQGQTVAGAMVEIRDPHGIQMGKGFTDSAGSFKISTAAEPGEYILLAAKGSQLGQERITVDQESHDIKIALPATLNNGALGPSQFTVSVQRLSIPAEVRSHLKSARKEFGRMNLSGAAGEIDRALRIAPTCAQAFSMRAFIELAGGDFRGAVADAAHAAFLDSNDAQSYIALANAYNSLKEFSKASDAAGKALGIDSQSWQARLEMAKSLYGQSEFILALHELDLIGKNFPDVHLVRGNVLMRLDRCREAVDEYGIFVREAPGDLRGERLQGIMATVQQAALETSSARP